LWSLSIEEQFYLLWPLLLVKIGKKSFASEMAAVISLLGIFSAILVVVGTGSALHIEGWNWMSHIKFGGLLVGCALRLAFGHPGAKAKIGMTFSGLSPLIFASMCAYLLLFRAKVTPIDPLICGLAVCSAVVEPNAIVARFLETSILKWIGRLSYSLYVWQQLFLGFGVVYRPLGFLNARGLELFSVLIFACLSYYLLERPLIRLGHRIAESSSVENVYFLTQSPSTADQQGGLAGPM
jgi:peptidoglycan/LPS O-acetylase OafA/YrhL